MSDHITFLLLGTGNGAVYAALGLALVVTYRSSGVINFATGPIALYCAYTYGYLRQDGNLVIIVPGFPKNVHLGGPMAFAPATAIALLSAALTGLVLYVAVFRWLRSAPPVAKAVASLGLLVMLQGVMGERLGTDPVAPTPIFGTKTFKIGDSIVLWDRIWFAVTILGVGLGLAAWVRFTRFGLATRAAAETEKGALASGLSPDRIAAVNWMVSAMVAGLSGILISPIVPLVPVAYTLFIVPALAAALMGGFQYLAPTVLAGLAIGMVQSDLTYLRLLHPGKWPWQGWPQGVEDLVPLLLIVGVLVIRGRPLPTRGALIQRTLGRAPRPSSLFLPTVVGVVVASTLIVSLHGSWRVALVTSLVYGIVALSWVVVTGYCGQVSLAQITLAGAAGFLLFNFGTELDIPFPLAPLLAATGAMVLGVVVGLPALRVRGLSVGVATLALAVAVEAVWFRNNDLNGGVAGANIDGPTFLGINLRVGVGAEAPRFEFCFLALGLLVVVALAVARLRRSRLGSAMLAVRANERSAAAAGVDVVRTKLLGFAIGAFIAGLGGVMIAYQQKTIIYNSFTAVGGLGLFGTVYLAGITSVAGGVVAGILAIGGLSFVATDRWLQLGNWYETVTGLLLIFTVIANPEGIVGNMHVMAAKLRTGRTRRREAAAPQEDFAERIAPALLARSDDEGARGGVLTLEDVGVRYGGVVAVENASFEVAAGQIAGLIGPNGAGKTSLIDGLTGFADCTGTVLLDGLPLGGLKAHERVKAGLTRTFQAIELYDDLSVTENVQVGLGKRSRRGEGSEEIERVFEVLGLGALRETPAGELSQGRRQLVSIARALVARPSVLLLDEPAAGLDTTESAWLADRLREVRDGGVTILLIDHDMGLVLGLCDYITVLDFGRIIASGPPSSIRTDRRVTEAYLGSTHAEPAVAT